MELMADGLWTLDDGQRLAVGADEGSGQVRMAAVFGRGKVVLKMTKSEAVTVIGLLAEALRLA